MTKKYGIFIKYIISASFSFIIDLTLFTIFNYILSKPLETKAIIVATIIARIISSFINYLLNKNKVFKSNKNSKKCLFEYYLLVIMQMFMSAILVYFINNLININASIIKIFVDGTIFIVNYFIQKKFIFKKTN